jgi:glycerol-3-phosphate acyltransferase PlsY
MNVVSLIIAYIVGSIPMGQIAVKVFTGKDLREEHSGRTGGTNAMRVGGFGVGLITTILDFLKSYSAVWLAKIITNEDPWIVATAAVLSVMGHNYSIFLLKREGGKLVFRGGAGGASTAGASTGLWAPSGLIVVPIGLFFLFGVGFASLATMTTGLTALIVFLVRALNGSGPWAYVFFGLAVEVLLLLGLKPNIERLLHGNERLVGWRAKKKRQQEQAQEGSPD